MAGESLTTGNSFRPTMADNELIKELRERSFMVNVPRWKNSQGAAGVAFSRITSTHTAATVSNGVTEADAITPTALTSSSATATPAARVAAVLASLVLMLGAAVDLQTEVPQLLARASMQAMDTDICTLGIAGTNTVGSTGVPLTVAVVQDAVTLFQRVALGVDNNAWMVLHPKQLGDVKQDALSSSSPFMAQANVMELFPNGAGLAINQALQGTFNGIPLFKSANVQDMNGNADHGGFIVALQYAIGGAMMQQPQTAQFDQRVNHKPAVSWFQSFIYGVVEIKDEGIITIISDHA
jgi:hypothetical protein